LKRILVVDGHAPTRELLERRLSGDGFEVSAAEDPRGAWEAFAALWPAAVVLAADLPHAEARALAQRIREVDPRHLLLVVDKAHLGRAAGVQEVLDLHANAYVADATSRELPERLRQLMAQSAPGRRADLLTPGTSRVLERAPAEQGDVRPGELPEVLLRLWRAGADGILEVQDRDRTRRLFLLRGSPVAFESDVRAESLGRWLVAGGNLSEAQYQASLDVRAAGEISEGAALVAAGALAPGEPLRAALRAHLCAMVSLLAALREGRWRLRPGADFFGEVPAVDVPALAPILDGVRAALPTRHFAQALKGELHAYPARSPGFPRLVPAMALGSADLRLALALTGRVTTRAFLEERRAGLRDALPLLWFLERVGAVAFHPAPVEAGDAPRQADAAPVPARRRKPLPEERARDLRQAALEVLPGSYFRALGVDISADIDEIERAYHEAATRFHPDSFAAYDVGPLEDLLAQVQEKLGAAYRVLANEEKRRAYLAFLLAREATETGRRREAPVPEAEVALKRGERALRERRVPDAVTAFQEAVQRNAREPEYLALLAFAVLHDARAPEEERPRSAARLARRALALDPDCVRAQIVLALSEMAGGDVGEARKRLLAALRAAPGNALARRALALVNQARAGA
jgi:DNA-binding NarL/FixJ family response regulator/tetratricopeptide (TPR) repeat protein